LRFLASEKARVTIAFAMISEDKARARILAAVTSLPVTKVELTDALDRFAAEDVNAPIALPSFDNSAMDGYAVVAADVRRGVRLRVIGEQAAGVSRQFRIVSGEAVRIFTGAPLPAGSDAVVMQEETKECEPSAGERPDIVIETESVRSGDFVRHAGGDLAAGQQILRKGERLSPATLALLGSQGISTVAVHRRASVAIVTTGDEIVPPGGRLREGEIFESNGTLLTALAKRAGAEVTTYAHARDNFAELSATLRKGGKADALIISGGVSVGERDLVRRALHEMGASIDLWRVKIKPGKPFLFGRLGDCAVFGLPGNPVSSFITFLVLARPALLKMMGAGDAELHLQESIARLGHDLMGDEARPHYIRGRIECACFTAIGRQESHALDGLTRANALLRLAPGANLPAGSEVMALLII
jgi:molybdopterin molybdotransferase